MDDMTAFERQVAGEFVRRAGPVHPVDAAGILGAITATQYPRWRFRPMVSATRFVVAGAVVALFGGFLLTGFMVQPRDVPSPAAVSPSTIEDRLSTLETAEVGPGMFRVLGDGNEHHRYDGFDHVVAGPDGSVWVRRSKRGANDRVWLVGGPVTLPRATRGNLNPDAYLMAVDAHGRLVEAHHDGLSIGRTAEDPATVFTLSGFAPTALTVLPDDTVWASWRSERDTVRLGMFDAQGWTEYATPDGVESIRDVGYAAGVSDVVATPDGDVWIAISDNWGAGFGGGALVRFDGTSWTEEQPFGDDASLRISDVHDLAIAPDGSLWVLAWLLAEDEGDVIEGSADHTGSAQALLHFDGRAWEAHRSRDVLTDLDPSELGVLQAPMVVDEAGRLWASLERLTLGEPTQRTLGHDLISFDGTTTAYYRAVGDVADIAIDDDGVIWAAAADGLYVILPEAAAASASSRGVIALASR